MTLCRNWRYMAMEAQLTLVLHGPCILLQLILL